MRRLLLLAALALACSRNNPRFIVASATDTGDASTEPADTAATTSGEATLAGTDSTDSTGDIDRVCRDHAPEPSLGLAAYLGGAPLVPTAPCPPQRFAGSGTIAASGLEITANKMCSLKMDPVLRVETSFVNDVPWPLDECLVVELAWTADCSALRGIVVWSIAAVDLGLVAVGVAGTEEVPPGAELLQPTFELAEDSACACEPGAKVCCPNGVPTAGDYTLRFPDAAATVLGADDPPAASADFGDNLDFYLDTMRSHVHACAEDGAPLHLDWFAVRTL